MDGDQLRRRRTTLNLTQAELGRRLGVSGQAIYKWETGRNKIERDVMLDLSLRCLALETAARALGKEPEELALAPFLIPIEQSEVVAMEEPTDPYGEWTRPLLGQPTEITSTYVSEEIRDNAIRAHTVRAHEQEISSWLVSQTLISSAFEPHRVYDSKTPEPGSEEDSPEAQQLRSAFALRLQLLGLVGRSAKPILDLILAGYYTEAWSLLRTMLDGWARCLFVRLSPREYVRWYEREDQQDEKPVDWAQIGNVVEALGTDEDRALFQEAKLRWELLHMGTHPSGEGIGQVRNDELNIFMYRPEYHHGFCMHAFSAGVFVMRVLIREIQLLGGHEEWWIRTVEKHAADVESLEVSITPTLNEMADRMERRAARRRAARRQARKPKENK